MGPMVREEREESGTAESLTTPDVQRVRLSASGGLVAIPGTERLFAVGSTVRLTKLTGKGTQHLNGRLCTLVRPVPPDDKSHPHDAAKELRLVVELCCEEEEEIQEEQRRRRGEEQRRRGKKKAQKTHNRFKVRASKVRVAVDATPSYRAFYSAVVGMDKEGIRRWAQSEPNAATRRVFLNEADLGAGKRAAHAVAAAAGGRRKEAQQMMVPEVLALLGSLGADFSKRCDKGATPAWYACRSAQTSAARLAALEAIHQCRAGEELGTSRGCFVGYCDDDLSPLDLAVLSGDAASTRFLIQTAGVDPEVTSPKSGHNAATRAVLADKLASLEALVECGAKLIATGEGLDDHDDWTLADAAALFGRYKTARWLQRRGVRCDAARIEQRLATLETERVVRETNAAAEDEKLAAKGLHNTSSRTATTATSASTAAAASSDDDDAASREAAVLGVGSGDEFVSRLRAAKAYAERRSCAWCGAARADRTCSRCRRCNYCSKAHQVAHFRSGHRTSCALLDSVERAAENQDADAMCRLGLAYLGGEVVDGRLDSGKAAYDFRFFFCNKHGDTTTDEQPRRGRTVPFDRVKAREWIDKARTAGHVEAHRLYAVMCEHGLAPGGDAAAIDAYRAAAALGSLDARYWLAVATCEGRISTTTTTTTTTRESLMTSVELSSQRDENVASAAADLLALAAGDDAGGEEVGHLPSALYVGIGLLFGSRGLSLDEARGAALIARVAASDENVAGYRDIVAEARYVHGACLLYGQGLDKDVDTGLAHIADAVRLDALPPLAAQRAATILRDFGVVVNPADTTTEEEAASF